MNNKVIIEPIDQFTQTIDIIGRLNVETISQVKAIVSLIGPKKISETQVLEQLAKTERLRLRPITKDKKVVKKMKLQEIAEKIGKQILAPKKAICPKSIGN
jgi:hypothetical protein